MPHLKKIFSTPEIDNYFFGYYEKSPLSFDNSKILAHRVEFIDRLPQATDKCDIGYFDLDNPSQFIKIQSTNAFNWQQGSMLQWVGPDFSKRIIFNDFDNYKNQFISKIIDIETQKSEELPLAIYSLDSSGKKAYCVDFERHYWFRRGYAYASIENKKKSKKFDPDDGISVLDLYSHEHKQIINMKELISLSHISTMNDAIHYVEHIIPNKSANKIAFLHRWQHSTGIHTRLLLADSDGQDLKILNDSGRVSHFNWIDDKELILWGASSTPFNVLRKNLVLSRFILKPLLPIYKKFISSNSISGNSRVSRYISGDSYIRINIDNMKAEPVGKDILMQDGHPSISPIDKKLLLSDIYPNEESKLNFFLYNLDSSLVIDRVDLSSISTYDNTPLRCDLHPKWSYDGNYVAVDTMNQGKRDIFLYRLVDN